MSDHQQGVEEVSGGGTARVGPVSPYSSCLPLEYSNSNVTLYVYSQLGDRCVTPSIVTPTVVIYGFILLLGVLGNVCTCLVIARNRSMQNPTNYYLFSLALSDLTLLVLGLPMELYSLFDVLYPYRFGEFVCKSRAFLIEFTSYASILTITSFSVERWLAICFVYENLTFSTLDRAVKVIALVWLCAFVAASPVAFIVVLNRLPIPDFVLLSPNEPVSHFSHDNRTLAGTDYCAMDFQQPDAQRVFIYATFLVFFLLPAFLITLVYCHIVYRLSKSSRNPAVADSKEKQKLQSRKNLLKILVSVVLLFFLCWFPFHLQRLLTVFLNNSQRVDPESADSEFLPPSTVQSVFNVIFYISGYCYYANSAVNPILYNILSEKYRLATCRMILGERLTRKIWWRGRGSCRYRSTQINQKCSLCTELFPLQRSGQQAPWPSVLATPCTPSPLGNSRRNRSLQHQHQHQSSVRCGRPTGKGSFVMCTHMPLQNGHLNRLRLLKSNSTACNPGHTPRVAHAHCLSPARTSSNASTGSAAGACLEVCLTEPTVRKMGTAGADWRKQSATTRGSAIERIRREELIQTPIITELVARF